VHDFMAKVEITSKISWKVLLGSWRNVWPWKTQLGQDLWVWLGCLI